MLLLHDKNSNQSLDVWNQRWKLCHLLHDVPGSFWTQSIEWTAHGGSGSGSYKQGYPEYLFGKHTEDICYLDKHRHFTRTQKTWAVAALAHCVRAANTPPPSPTANGTSTATTCQRQTEMLHGGTVSASRGAAAWRGCQYANSPKTEMINLRKPRRDFFFFLMLVRPPRDMTKCPRSTRA